MIEIKVYGSGGQGAVVLATLLANAAVKTGYQAQSFASYGSEIRGGKVESYVRIAEEKITVHSKMYKPDYVIILDEKFTREPGIVSGLKDNGGVLINSPDPPEAFSTLGNFKIITINALSIARKQGLLLPSGATVINTAVLGAAVGMIPFISIEAVAEAIRDGNIPLPDKNIQAAQEAYLRVKSPETAATTAGEEAVLKIPGEQYPVYKTGISPCETDCPAGHEIRKTVSLIYEGRFEEALENVKMENPFPGICGRVCFHPCETNCNRNEYDEGIAINALERAAYDYADTSLVRKPARKETTGKKVAIIGSGPAGMTCAYFLALLGHSVSVFEALPVPGGIPRVGIPEYRLPKDVVDTEIKQILEYGIQVVANTKVGKDIAFEKLTKEYDACFLATGAQGSMRLNIPGEDSEGVISGLEFLKKVTLGNTIKVGARVAVIGGGNTAVDAARTAKRLGAEEVTIVYRRSAEEMPAYPNEVAAAVNEGIEIAYLTMPVQIHHNGKRVNKLECAKTRLGEKDKDGRRRPEKVEGSNFSLDVDTVIAAAGETLETSFLPADLEMEDSLIKVDCLGRTSIPGIYAGGDATTFSRSVTNAIGSGKRAALGIDTFLKGSDELLTIRFADSRETGAISMKRYLAGNPAPDGNSKVSFSDLNTDYFSPASRIRVPELPSSTRALNFNEVNLGLSRTEAIEEASRCFQCGQCNLCENCYIFCPDLVISFDETIPAFTLDQSACKRCGICIEECPRHAISWGGEVQ